MQAIYPKNILYTFTFGHFKGLKMIDVYTGSTFLPAFAIKYWIEKYLQSADCKDSFIDYSVYTDGRIISIIPKLNLWQVKLTRSLDESVERVLKYMEGNKDIACDLLANVVENAFRTIFSFSSGSIHSIVYDLNDMEFFDWNARKNVPYTVADGYNLFVCNGSPAYLDWCINSFDDFFITSEVLEALQRCKIKRFDGFKLEKLSDTVFEIVQLSSSYEYSMTETTIERNAEKYKEYTRRTKSAIVAEVISELYPPSEPEEYTEQDNIDDAFGGEESAYWNID